LIAEDRKSTQNGIWLCQKCGTLVDADSSNYPVNLLLKWKMRAEELARLELAGKPIPPDLESEGYFCGHCDTFVKTGNTICLGCHAEVAYGSKGKNGCRISAWASWEV
jgi:RNA polymerase subunit RPABC4/transcription elongation factor Spt4